MSMLLRFGLSSVKGFLAVEKETVRSLASWMVERQNWYYKQGRQEGGAEGAVCPRASGSMGPHQVRSKFLFIASLEEFKEPPNRSSLQDSRSASSFSSLAFCPFCSLQSQTQGASFCIVAPGPQKPLGGPDDINRFYILT